MLNLNFAIFRLHYLQFGGFNMVGCSENENKIWIDWNDQSFNDARAFCINNYEAISKTFILRVYFVLTETNLPK